MLTRLPTPCAVRRAPWATASKQLLRLAVPKRRCCREASVRLSALGIADGSIYDALVGAAALQHRLRLATRDRRAIDTYRKLDVDLEILA